MKTRPLVKLTFLATFLIVGFRSLPGLNTLQAQSVVPVCAGCSGGNNGGGSSGGGTGGSGASCPKCEGGMPVWEVSEPYINVWLYDEPLGYQPAIGDRVSFKLAYKQRESRTIASSFFGMGKMWDCSWLSYILDDGSGSSATMEVPGGGERTYTPDNATLEFLSQTILQRTTDGSGNLTGFILSYANGAKDYYGFVPSELLDTHSVAFLTAQVDPFGHTNLFVYQDTNSATFLKYVVDTDGRTNTLSYTNIAYPTQITGVQDPFGRSMFLHYDSSGMLTNVTDVAGTNSYFAYDSQGWVTNLTTPYGTTLFQHLVNSEDPANEFTGFNPCELVRSVKVIDAVGGTNVYMLRQDSSLVFTNAADFTNSSSYYADLYAGNYDYFLPYNYDSSLVPVNNPEFSFDNSYLYYRDSFHWGPKQAAGLPVDVTTFSASDYLKARMQHWLHDNITGNLSQTIDLEQDPSPDGMAPGQTTWYEYDGKDVEIIEGQTSLPAMIGRVLPDGTTWYIWYRRDQWERPTNVVETYSMGYGATLLTRTNIYIYDVNGIDLIQRIGPLGEITGYAYNGSHQVIRATNALAEVTFFDYGGNGRLVSVKTPAGLTTTNIYFTSGLYTNYLQTTIDLEIGRTNSYTYTNNLVYTHIDERGLITTNAYDALQRFTTVSDSRGTVSYTYDKLDLAQVVDRMGFTNSFTYDAVRRTIAETNALGYYTVYNYCTCGALDSIRDMNGNYTYFSYDNAGRLLQTSYPDGYTVNNNYDLMGNVTNITDSSGATITNWFNNQGLRYAVSNAFGQVSARVFDTEDRVTNSVDANGVTITNTFDLLGRILTRGYPDGGVERFGYTPGITSLTSYTNQITNVVTYAYDPAGRKTNEVHVGISTNGFTYSPAGNLTNLVDGLGHATAWRYDQYGRVTNKLDNLGTNLFVYGYDPDNRLTNRISAAKGSTTYKYDAAGNLTNVVYPVSSNIVMAYDALNRLTNMVDGVGATRYTYDAASQLLSEGGLWPNDTVNYTYNNRLRTSLSLQAPNASAWTESYGYDSAGRLTSLISPAGAFSYTLGGASPASPLISKLSLPNGAYITNTYDSVARLLSTKLLNPSAAVLDSESYNYNLGGQRTQQTFAASNYMSYTYDDAGELKTAFGKEAGGVTNRLQEQFGYVYDPAGNLNYRTNNGLTETFVVNGLNELSTITHSGTLTVAGTTTSQATNVTVNSITATQYNDFTFAKDGFSLSVGANTFTAVAKDSYGRIDTNIITVAVPAHPSYLYDLNGNLLSDNGSASSSNRFFAYDDENQLTSVWVTNTWRSDFVYDGKMRRRIRYESTWNGSTWVTNTTVRYIYDGNLVIQERDANNLPQVSYTRGPDLSGRMQGAGGIGGLLARSVNFMLLAPSSSPSANAYYHADGNGNIMCLINSSNAIVAKYEYDPFGKILSQSGLLADANLYRFSSKEIHQNSGLVYYLYRFYDPNLQRWPNRDPFTERGFEVIRGKTSMQRRFAEVLEGPNLYEFVLNTPINETDLFGLGGMPPPHPGGSGPGSSGCACQKAGGKWEPYWQGKGYKNPIQCANASLDDILNEYFPSFLDIPMKIAIIPWLAELDRCSTYQCTLH